MSLDHRFARYAALATVPTAVTGAAHAGATFYQYNTPVSVTARFGGGFTSRSVYGSLAGSGLAAVGIDIDLRVVSSSWGGFFRAAEIVVRGGSYAGNKNAWFLGGTASRTISAQQGPNLDFYTRDAEFSSDGSGNWFASELTPGTGYIGLYALPQQANGQHGFSAWFQYELTINPQSTTLTILSYAYDLYGGPIMMPGTGGSNSGGGGGAVPGIGGLAALACGAAGVRRNRQRVA